MKIEIVGQTDKGIVRSNNEDNFYVDERQGLFVVADGAGGQATGEVASRLAVDIIKQQVEKYFRGEDVLFGARNPGFSDATNALTSSIRFANQIIYEASKKYPQNQGMATTCVAAMFSGDRVSYCNVGDSRLYLCRDGQMKLITVDHSLVMEQLKRGLITEEQAEKAEYKNVLTRALGSDQSVEVDMFEIPAAEGDVLLACSDGLTRMLRDETIKKTVQDGLSATGGAQQGQESESDVLKDICSMLISQANALGGRDNITVALARVVHHKEGAAGILKKIWKGMAK